MFEYRRPFKFFLDIFSFCWAQGIHFITKIILERESEVVSYLPVVKYGQTESLPLSVRSQICFKSKRVDSRNESLHCVQR